MTSRGGGIRGAPVLFMGTTVMEQWLLHLTETPPTLARNTAVEERGRVAPFLSLNDTGTLNTALEGKAFFVLKRSNKSEARSNRSHNHVKINLFIQNTKTPNAKF